LTLISILAKNIANFSFPHLRSIWNDEDEWLTTSTSPSGLSISEDEEKDKGRKYYRQATKSFSYRVAVPGDVDTNAEPTATYKNGVMAIEFLKSPKSQPKKIKVQLQSGGENAK
jgi:HSP20 family molecular chaperone IbpA